MWQMPITKDLRKRSAFQMWGLISIFWGDRAQSCFWGRPRPLSPFLGWRWTLVDSLSCRKGFRKRALTKNQVWPIPIGKFIFNVSILLCLHLTMTFFCPFSNNFESTYIYSKTKCKFRKNFLKLCTFEKSVLVDEVNISQITLAGVTAHRAGLEIRHFE